MNKLLNFLLVIILFIGAFYLGYQYKQTQSPIPQQQPKPTKPTPTPSPMQVTTGFIEGSLAYPSEAIPENMEVCAHNQATDEVFCTAEHIQDPEKYTFRVGYNLEVPVGTYLVYAHLPGQDYKAYYSEFVTCGLSIDCPSHNPIAVNVNSGQTATADPQDWYILPEE